MSNFRTWSDKDKNDQIDPSFKHSLPTGFEEAIAASATANAGTDQAGTKNPDPNSVKSSSNSSSALLQEANHLAQQVHDLIPLSNLNRLLNPTKRAAQNRNAQRAFRLRKEQYIKELETQVSKTRELEELIESLRKENQELRNYILTLQSKLISDVPPLTVKKS